MFIPLHLLIKPNSTVFSLELQYRSKSQKRCWVLAGVIWISVGESSGSTWQKSNMPSQYKPWLFAVHCEIAHMSKKSTARVTRFHFDRNSRKLEIPQPGNVYCYVWQAWASNRWRNMIFYSVFTFPYQIVNISCLVAFPRDISCQYYILQLKLFFCFV